MLDVALRLTTTSFSANASKMLAPSRHTPPSSMVRRSSSKLPAIIGASDSANLLNGTSVMKPKRPWLMPTSGMPKRAICRAMPSIVPSPPTTTAMSQHAPNSAAVMAP
jgi:hypothetical protein